MYLVSLNNNVSDILKRLTDFQNTRQKCKKKKCTPTSFKRISYAEITIFVLYDWNSVLFTKTSSKSFPPGT